MIYADHAATTKLSPAARQAMLKCMEECWGNPSSIYRLGQNASAELQKARETIAQCLGASPKEIYFTSGGSESDTQALLCAAYAGARIGKKHIISTFIEHPAVLNTLKQLASEGFSVTLLPINSEGIVEVTAVASAFREDTSLVSVMFANNEIGTIQPIAEISDLCSSRGILFHTDAVQAAGHLPLNMKELCIDLLTLSAHKFCGPRGIGVLYARQGTPLQPLIFGGSQERGKRAGTENLPAIAGMAAAFRDACANMEKNFAHLTALGSHLIEELSLIPGSLLNGSRMRRLPGNVNFSFEGIDGEMLLLLLDQQGIAASLGSACASGSLNPSHVLLALGRSPELAKASLRLTLGEENTEQEVSQIISAVKETVALLRNIS